MSIFTQARRVLYAPAEAAIQVPFIIDRHAGVLPSYATDYAHSAGESEYPELWNGLVGFWPFFLGQTGGKVPDLSGKGNHGTLEGTAPSWTSGKFGSAVLFSGINEYIEIVYSTSLDVLKNNTPFTMNFLFSISKLASSEGHDLLIYGQEQDAGTTRSLVYIESDDNTIKSHIGGTGLSTGFVVTVNTTYLATVLYDGTNLILYVNGVQKVSAVKTPDEGGVGNYYIGRHKVGQEKYFEGLIELGSIYNRALPLNEIAFLSSNPTALVQLRRRVVMVSVPEVAAGIVVLRRRREAC